MPGRELLPVRYVAVLGLLVLGIPEGTIGVVWPSIRGAFDLPLGSLGVLVMVITAGYVAGSAVSGNLRARLRNSNLLMICVGCLCIATGILIIARCWAMVVAAGFLMGCGGGATDASLNLSLALWAEPRLMNFAHGAYGLGAAIGPIIAGEILVRGVWRLSYSIILGFELMLFGGLYLSRVGWPRIPTSTNFQPARGTNRSGHITGVVIFAAYVGVERGIGQWAYVFLTEGRGVRGNVAALCVSLFWVGLTSGRVLLALSGVNIKPRVVARLGGISAVLLLVSAGTGPAWWGMLALPLLGLSLAGIFPALILLTPHRLGRPASNRAIGRQIAAGSLGGAACSGIIGLVAGEIAPSAILICIALISGIFVAVNYIEDIRSRRSRLVV